jgi:hypothetical protein
MLDYTPLLSEMVRECRGDPHRAKSYARYLRRLGCPEDRIEEARRAALAVNPNPRAENEVPAQEPIESIVEAEAL